MKFKKLSSRLSICLAIGWALVCLQVQAHNDDGYCHDTESLPSQSDWMLSFANSKRLITLVGIVVADFPGAGWIQRVIDMNFKQAAQGGKTLP